VATGDYRPIYITIRKEYGILIVSFTLSMLTDDENIEQLGHELFMLVEHFGCRKMILSLQRVRYMTSSVLGKMISLHRKLHRDGGLLVVCNVGPEIDKVMRASRLINYFNFVDDVEAATQTFAAS